MSEYKILKEIALELLEKYRLSETGLIWEISGSISEDITRLEYECNYMRKQIEKAAEPRWIPVTERLPETSDPVLVTYIFHGDRLFTGAKIVREVATANYYNEAWFPHDCEFYYELVDVLAWMPLPESFKGGE